MPRASELALLNRRRTQPPQQTPVVVEGVPEPPPPRRAPQTRTRRRIVLPNRPHPLPNGILLVTCILAISVLSVLVSIALSEWLRKDVTGLITSIGLIRYCVPSYEQQTYCGLIPSESLNGTWNFTIALSSLGLLFDACSLACYIRAFRYGNAVRGGRLCGIIAALFLLLALVVFPAGFSADVVGGVPYKLPHDTSIGLAFGMFVAGTLLCVSVELGAHKLSQRVPPWPRRHRNVSLAQRIGLL